MEMAAGQPLTAGAARQSSMLRRGFERARRRWIGPFLGRLGYDLLPATPEWEHRPLSQREIDTLIGSAARTLENDFRLMGLETREPLETIVRDFWDLIPTCPVRQRHGGNGFNGSLQLYAVGRILRPPVIIESGVFRGLTTWTLRQACPDASIYSFDPVLKELRYRDPRARYIEGDWSAYDFGALDFSQALAFFDDHISQARRIVEASERGIRRLVFDDNACPHKVHAHGGPAFPTIDMILSIPPGGPAIRWVRNGREFTYAPDESLASKARGLIETALTLDDLHSVTGYSPSRLCYVTLKAGPGADP
jgi:hypothetical protein